MNKILTIVAHPDDEILGCGGTIKRLTNEGDEAFTLLMGNGITSRDNYKSNDVVKLLKSAVKANKIIGVPEENLFIEDGLEDNQFDNAPLLTLVKIVDKVKDKIKPDIIFTHFKDDLNIDHKLTYQAVITSTRPTIYETVKQIYSFEVPSSTEWAFPLTFSPNTYFDITNTIKDKIKALQMYKSELHNKVLHPRSIKGIKLLAQTHGIKVGMQYSEAFQCIRSLI